MRPSRVGGNRTARRLEGFEPEPRVDLLADSGDPGDETRPVYLHGESGRRVGGVIRGALPSLLHVGGQEYLLSGFTQTDGQGAVVHSYRLRSQEASPYK